MILQQKNIIFMPQNFKENEFRKRSQIKSITTNA